MNWGTKITITYIAFVVLIVSMVFISSKNKSELESKEYYAKELKFQEQINATENSNNLSFPINYKVENKSVRINLPQEVLSGDLSGTVLFLRPSDASKDKNIELKVDENGEQIINSDFEKGVYKMQISFTGSGKNYFKEAVINFK